jgi:calpain, invertebrate
VHVKLKVCLAIAEKGWKSQTKNAVGGMIGLYLLTKTDHKIVL